MLYVCILQSFLVYLFNFYYAISELEQNKQNNTYFFFTIYFFNKKVDLSSLRGVRAHPSHPPSLRACYNIWKGYMEYSGPKLLVSCEVQTVFSSTANLKHKV